MTTTVDETYRAPFYLYNWMSPHPWNSGGCKLFIDRRTEDTDKHMKWSVRVVLPEFDVDTYAYIDTGAFRNIIGGRLAERILQRRYAGGDPSWGWRLPLDGEAGEEVLPRFGGRGGRTAYSEEVLTWTIPNDVVGGRDLELEATTAIAPDWSGPSVMLGDLGMLERMRSAYDHARSGARFYFSLASEVQNEYLRNQR